MKIESKQLQVKLICTVFLLQHHPWIPFILLLFVPGTSPVPEP